MRQKEKQRGRGGEGRERERRSRGRGRERDTAAYGRDSNKYGCHRTSLQATFEHMRVEYIGGGRRRGQGEREEVGRGKTTYQRFMNETSQNKLGRNEACINSPTSGTSLTEE